MTHRLRFDENALKSLEKLSTDISERIIKKLRTSKNNPYRYFKRLSSLPQFSLRVGDYRIIADIDEQYVTILYIDHRKRVYDRF